jgi:hypothetical protein
MQERREIGRHFLMFLASPFFGISLIIAVLKLCVKVPFSKAFDAYLAKGVLKMYQYFLIKAVFKPSMPAADFEFAPSSAVSSAIYREPTT